MRESFGNRDALYYAVDPEFHVWWTQILPEFVDELRRERDAAHRERDAARRERDAARRECAAARRDRDAMRSEAEEWVNGAEGRTDEALRGWDSALAERDKAVKERDEEIDEAMSTDSQIEQMRLHMLGRIEELEAEIERMTLRMLT